jgi:hypothetical protein
MITEVALAAALLTVGRSPELPRLTVRVLDVDCHALPGMPLLVFRSDTAPGEPMWKGVTNTAGEASFPAEIGARYDIVAKSQDFVDTRVGPIPITKERLLRPVVVVFNLSLDWTVVLPPHGDPLMDKNQ